MTRRRRAMLEVIEAGPLTTVQDGGRPDAVELGVPVGGACDAWSLAVANALLGNAPSAAALEMSLAGGSFRALADCAVALAGAEMEGRIVEREEPVPGGTATELRAGQTLAFGAAREGTGVRAYLALSGGVDVPPVLGSPSTCLIGGFGGLGGRALRSGDVVRSREGRGPIAGRWPGPPNLVGQRLRVVRGPHLDALPPGTFEALAAGAYEFSGRGDRQGIRLDGPPLAGAGRATIVSQPLVWGAVQLPPDGRPIVLLADHQTVGGYPVVAVVISADQPLLGQLGPGDEVCFAEIDQQHARAALLEREAQLDALRRALS